MVSKPTFLARQAARHATRRRLLEEVRELECYQLKTDFGRRVAVILKFHYLLEDAHTFVRALADGHGAIRDELRARIANCTDLERLYSISAEVAGATDRTAVEGLLERLLPTEPTDE